MHLFLWALLLAALTGVPLHAQAGCERLDAAAVTQVIHRQRLATETGRRVDDGGGVCRVTFGGDAGPAQVVVVRLELGDVAAARGSMQAGQGGTMTARALAGVGDEAFVSANPSGDGAAAEVRDGTALVMVQVLTQRGTERAKLAAAADVARLLFGRAAAESAAITVASAPRPSDPDPTLADPAASAGTEPVTADDAPAAEEPEEDSAMTPIAIPPYVEGPDDVCRALPARTVGELLSAAGITAGEATTAQASGRCVYTFGPALSDAAVRVTVQYAGSRGASVAARRVAALRRRPDSRLLAGVGDEAVAVYGSRNGVIAYRVGLFSGLVEVLAPAAPAGAVPGITARIAGTWARHLATSSHTTSGGTP